MTQKEIGKRPGVYVNAPVVKKDAMALVTGRPVYTQDLAPKDCLTVKVLRSPHAHALIRGIDKTAAEKVPGIVCILTHRDTPHKRFTQAGQTYPEPSPYDRVILDERVRFVGDAAAIVAGENEACVDRALKLIKVEYEVLEPVLDFRKAKDNPVLVHPEEDWKALCPVGADNRRNLAASGEEKDGDAEAVFASCDLVFSRTYHTKANNQTMMETFRTFTYLDAYDRLNVVSSTQIPFHIRRILANALNISKSRVRVIKPRVGGGFGAKQTGVAEIYAAAVTMKTGQPAQIVYSRYESMIAASPRHEMEITVKMGLSQAGKVRAIQVYTLSNTGAYGEHGPTTVGLTGHKSIPLYTPEAFDFRYDVVYTNCQAAGAYRGYGATQGLFAVESSLNEAADLLGMDPVSIRLLNFVKEGDVMPAYYGERMGGCAVERCVKRCGELIGWEEKYPRRVMPDGKIRAVGMGISMQGSGISGVDVGSVTIRLSDEGTFNLMVGASDMGTGCDTILAQMAADCLDCELEDIAVYGVDTDTAPYDSGSYASSTTYVTGMAVVKACTELLEKIDQRRQELLQKGEGTDPASVSLAEIAASRQCGSTETLEATASHSSPISPPPLMCGMAEVEVDPETGKVTLTDFAGVVDCGTVINTNLARVQTEGGIAQGVGMALFEDVNYTSKGAVMENSFLQYKIPTRLDLPEFQIDFESSYEPSGPFGAKSIGEVVINTPAPAIAQAVYYATGARFRELPITPEKVLRATGKLARKKNCL